MYGCLYTAKGVVVHCIYIYMTVWNKSCFVLFQNVHQPGKARLEEAGARVWSACRVGTRRERVRERQSQPDPMIQKHPTSITYTF